MAGERSRQPLWWPAAEPSPDPRPDRPARSEPEAASPPASTHVRLARPAAGGPAAPGTAAGAGPGKRAPGKKKLAEVARGSTLNLVGVAVAAATTLALTVLVTRLFSGPVAGTFFSATSLFLIIESVASLGDTAKTAADSSR